MTTETKTPWKKNLDHRYISGEDLKDGVELGKGLKPEMLVTFSRFNDAPAFDQKTQKESDKTAIWLKEYPSGKMIYKPCLLNNERGKFLENEIGGGSMFLEDFDTNKPFMMYAKPSARFGFVVGFKKYAPPSLLANTENFTKCKAAIKAGTHTLDQVKMKYAVSAEVEKALLTD